MLGLLEGGGDELPLPDGGPDELPDGEVDELPDDGGGGELERLGGGHDGGTDEGPSTGSIICTPIGSVVVK